MMRSVIKRENVDSGIQKSMVSVSETPSGIESGSGGDARNDIDCLICLRKIIIILGRLFLFLLVSESSSSCILMDRRNAFFTGATVSKSLCFLAQKSRHFKIKCGGGISLLGQPVDFMDLIQLLVSAMSIPRAIKQVHY